MQSRIADLREAETQVLAICVDSVEKNAEVVKNLKLEFLILSDPDLVAIDAYGIRHKEASIEGGDVARPAVFILDREGVVRWRDLTENWRVRVRPEQVLEQIRKQEAGIRKQEAGIRRRVVCNFTSVC